MPVSHPEAPFEPRARAVSFALLLLAACAAPTISVAHDGTWAQLGVPFRFEAPLLWDGSEHRFVGIGASAFGATDSVEDAWEFRVSAGWRRMRLPQPPAGLDRAPRGPIADPERRRYVQLAYTDGSLDSLRAWALELGPEPHWACLDASTKVPDGWRVDDLSGTALWIETFPNLYTEGTDLWSRSLADSGEWRFVRRFAQGDGFRAHFVDAAHDRCIELSFGSDSATVRLLPLSRDEGWTVAPTGSPASPRNYPRMIVPDAARERLLCFFADVNQPGDHQVWALVLDSAPRWELLGAADYSFDHTVTGIAADTLVLHGQGATAGQPGARTIAVSLRDPMHARVLSDPAWPPPLPSPALVPDAAGGRWLLVGGRSGQAPLGSPLDSLWELRRYHESVTWRRLAVAGAGPVVSGDAEWAVDEAEGTLYVLNGWNRAFGTVADKRELWALHPETPPRWELLDSGGPDDWPRLGTPVFVFDSARRKLVCFGYQPDWSSPRANEVWEYDVDRRDGWTLAIPSGTVPVFYVGSTAAFDAVHSRVVMLGVNAQIVALHTSPDLWWEIVHCADSAGGLCLPAQYGMHAAFDPVGHRVLELGGYDPFWPHVGEGQMLYGLPTGDSLGPVRALEALGSPGWQDVPTMGYDRERDALLVFGNGTGASPDLLEFAFDRSGAVVARPRAGAGLQDRIVLRWTATPGATFRLWRRASAGEWVVHATISATSAGELAFDDRAVEAGTRYGYRLTVSPTATETVSADVWVTAATSGSLSLARPWPNPVRGALNVAFTSAVASPAELDLFDVAGRRVWSRRWAAPAPGPHHAVIAAGELPRAGLYFLRLRQAGLAATRRVVLAP